MHNTRRRQWHPLQYSCLENPMDGGAWWAAVHGVAKNRTLTEQLHFHFSLSCIGEGNGNPLQCSCLENPRDGGAWWAAVYRVAQSWTWLKRLSSSSMHNTGLPWWFSSKESAHTAGDQGSIPGSGRSPGGGQGSPLHYPCLENPMDRGAWQPEVRSITQSPTWLKQLSSNSCSMHNIKFMILTMFKCLVQCH